MKNILIGILTYNGGHRMASCLKSIFKWEDVPDGYKVNILLLDDGSSDVERRNEALWCSAHFNLPIILHSGNFGISRSWNDICHYGNSDIIVLLNDDIIVADNWLTTMTYFLNNPYIGMVGWNQDFIKYEDVQVILDSKDVVRFYRDPRTKEDLGSPNSSSDKPGRMMVATGSAFAFHRSVYDLAGGFDERYFSMYEEMDFGTNLTSKGYPSYMLHYPQLYHIYSATFSENPHLEGNRRLVESRAQYIKKWDGDLDYTDAKFMPRLDAKKVKWLDEKLIENEGLIT